MTHFGPPFPAVRVVRRLRNCVSDQRGYTLFELVLAMTIFAIVLMTAVGSYVSVSQSSVKASSQRNVQQDVRFNVEEIGRQARASSIDYPFYNLNSSNACSLPNRNALALVYTEAGVNNAPQTKRVIYFYDTSVPNDPAVYRYETGNTTVAPDCTAVGRDGSGNPKLGNERVTANNVRVSEARFVVVPDKDPYNAQSAAAAQYTHPRVTILMSVQTTVTGSSPSQTARQSTATVQTTISSRSYPVVKVPGQATLGTPPPTADPCSGGVVGGVGGC